MLSDSLQLNHVKTNIESVCKSDHSPAVLKIIIFFTHKKSQTRPLWKPNNSLLGDINYVREVNKTMDSIKNRYALPVYNHENIYKIPNSEIQFTINDHLFCFLFLICLWKYAGKHLHMHQTRKKESRRVEE